MSQIHHISQEQLERKQIRQRRKELRDKVFTIVILTLAGLFFLWYIITIISHHV